MNPPRTRFTARPRAGVLVLCVAALPALTGVVLQVASRSPLTPDVLFLVVDVMVALVYGSVAAVILSRRSHPVAWLIGFAAVGAGIAALGGGWASYAIAAELPAETIGMAVFGSAWVPGTLSLFLVVPWLVRETRLSRVEGAGLIVSILVTTVMTVQRLVFPMSDNRLTILAVVVMGLITALSVLVRRRSGPAAQHPGLGLLALGTAVMALSFLPLVLVEYTSASVLLLVPASHLACQAIFPAALLVTMLRNRLWGIDITVSRAVLAGLLTLGMALVYATLVWAASWVVGSSGIAQIIAAVGVVLGVQPIRSWLEQRVQNLIWGQSTSPGTAALRIGASLSTVRDAEEFLNQLAGALGEALRLESVTVEVHDESAPFDRSSGGWGTPTSTPVERPVTAGKTTQHDDAAPVRLGVVTMTPRPGERLDRRTLEALDRLQPMIAAGLGLIRSAREVTRARDAANGARLAERRLIRRELHDGMGPWLSGLQLGLQGARNVLRTDPQAADAVLHALQSETAQRVEDVRMLSRSLLPPVLEERGLSAAVQELATRHAESGFAVEAGGLLTSDPQELRGLDPRVAAAAYAVISESIINAARHSGAAQSTVTVTVEGTGASRELVVTCSDTGSGRSATDDDGVGTASMRERVEELQGRLTITGRHMEVESAARECALSSTVPAGAPKAPLISAATSAASSSAGTAADASVSATASPDLRGSIRAGTLVHARLPLIPPAVAS
jgi:signal transduction histidine kinase